MSDQIEILNQAIDELRQQNIAMHYAYRVLAGSLAQHQPLDLQKLQAALRIEADNLQIRFGVQSQVPSNLNELANYLLSDFFVSTGMSRDQANRRTADALAPD